MKADRKDPPYYYFEGKGWQIDTKVKNPNGDGYLHVSAQWYPTKKDARADYDRVVEEFLAGKVEKAKRPKTILWEDLTSKYIAFRATRVKGSSLLVEKQRLSKWLDPLFNGRPAFECFGAEQADEVNSALRKSSMTTKVKNKIIALYLGILEFAWVRDMVKDLDYKRCRSIALPFRDLDDAPAKPAKKNVLNDEQIEMLLGVIEPDSTDYVLTRLLFATGMRIGEALALTPADVDLDNGIIHVRATMAPDEFGNYKRFARTKTSNSARDIPLRQSDCDMLSERITALMISPNEPIFLRKGNVGGVIDRSAYSNRLKGYCRKAGLPEISPHCARHSLATKLSKMTNSDADKQAVASILGHSVIIDQELYAKHSTEEKAKELINKA